MQTFDLFIQKSVHTIDLYLSQLTNSSEMSAYSKVVMYSQIGALLTYQQLAAVNDVSMEVRTYVNDVLLKAYAITAKNDFQIASHLKEVLLQKPLKSDNSIFCIASNSPSLDARSAFFAQSIVEISSNISSDIILQHNFVEQTAFEIATEVDDYLIGFISYASSESVIGMASNILATLEKFVEAAQVVVGIHSEVGDLVTTKYRTLGEMQTLIFSDLENMSMLNISYITV